MMWMDLRPCSCESLVSGIVLTDAGSAYILSQFCLEPYSLFPAHWFAFSHRPHTLGTVLKMSFVRGRRVSIFHIFL